MIRTYMDIIEASIAKPQKTLTESEIETLVADFRRALVAEADGRVNEGVGRFIKKHPFISAALAGGALAGAVALGNDGGGDYYQGEGDPWGEPQYVGNGPGDYARSSDGSIDMDRMVPGWDAESNPYRGMKYYGQGEQDPYKPEFDSMFGWGDSHEDEEPIPPSEYDD